MHARLGRTAERRIDAKGSAMNGSLRGLVIAGISAAALVAAAGCGGIGPVHPTAGNLKAATHGTAPITQQAQASPPAGQPTDPSPAAPSPNVPAVPAAPSAAPVASYQGPHFSSPAAAMTYLAAAFNSGNDAALHTVTTPSAFDQLTQMHSEAVNLQLQNCTVDAGHGDYLCYFSHDYPASLHQAGHGASTILVAPAKNPGWYMYTLVECG